MIDQSLIDKIELVIDEYSDGHAAPYFDCEDIQELLSNYKSLIEQNAELHKELTRARAILAELEESH